MIDKHSQYKAGWGGRAGRSNVFLRAKFSFVVVVLSFLVFFFFNYYVNYYREQTQGIESHLRAWLEVSDVTVRPVNRVLLLAT